MKRLLLSMTMLFAFSMTSMAQWGPGEDGGLGGGGGDVLPDLIILNTTAPTTWSTNLGLTMEITVRNRHNSVGAAASRIRILTSVMDHAGVTWYIPYFVNVPAFAAYETDKVITFTWSPSFVSGIPMIPVMTLVSITADQFNWVTEANETNNIYTP